MEEYEEYQKAALAKENKLTVDDYSELISLCAKHDESRRYVNRELIAKLSLLREAERIK